VRDHIRPFLGFRRLRDQLQLDHVTTDRCAQLVSENQSRENLAGALPRLGEGLESDVLREEDAHELMRAGENVLVRLERVSIVNRGDHVDSASLQLVRDRPRNMDVQVQADCLSENAPGSKAKDDGRFSTPLTVFLRDRKLRQDLRVDLRLMVKEQRTTD
jgi:hypothetical protein